MGKVMGDVMSGVRTRTASAKGLVKLTYQALSFTSWLTGSLKG